MAKSVLGGGALFNYVCNPTKGFEVDRNLVSSNNSKELFDDFKVYIEQNQRASKKIFSMVLSPAIEDGHRLNQKDYQSITREFLEELNAEIKSQPYVAFLHNEKKHFHVHIIASRVKEDGSLIKDNHVGKKAQWAAHRVALNRKLVSARQISIDKSIAVKKEKNTINTTQKTILNVHRSIISQPLTYEEYKRKMFENGYLIQPYLNKQKQLQGHKIIDIHSGKDYKASDIHRSMSLNYLFKQRILPNSKETLHKTLEKAYQEGLTHQHNDLTNSYKYKMR